MTLREAYFFIGDLMERAYSWHINSRVLGFDVSEFEGKCEGLLRLLNTQEPRVMTLSWVRNLKESTPIWLEDVDKKDVIGALFMRDYSGTKCVDFAIVRDWEFGRVVADYMDYGIRWRVWTSRPTDEQRKATPWE